MTLHQLIGSIFGALIIVAWLAFNWRGGDRRTHWVPAVSWRFYVLTGIGCTIVFFGLARVTGIG